MKKIFIIAVFLSFFTIDVLSQGVPAKLQVRLVLKILSMDKNSGRYGDPIKIGVSSDFILNAFKEASEMKIKGKSFVVKKMGSPGDIGKFRVVYIDKNWSGKYGDAGAKATASKSLMFCSEESGIKGGGGAISFKVVDGKPKILVNLGNSAKQGSDFPDNFLQMVVLVK